MIVFGGLLRWPTCTYFGSRTISSANRTTSSGIVAEKSSVCRTAGSAAMMRRTSGQKPMSIMRSASSSTSSSTPLEVGVLLPHVIDQPARRGDDDVDAGLERALLHAHLDAAVDGGARDGRVVREAVDLVFDLHGELARRREHQHAALAAVAAAAPASTRSGRGPSSSAAAAASGRRTPRSCRCRFRRRR